jgi:hypothetical protein
MGIWVKQLLVGFVVEQLGVEGQVLRGQNGEWLDEG